jgi:hypothetical protein
METPAGWRFGFKAGVANRLDMRQTQQRAKSDFPWYRRDMAMASQESEIGRILRLCAERGLLEVTQSTSYGAPSIKVKAKNFASVRGPNEMVLHCPIEQKDLLMEMAPDIYWQTDHFKGWPGLLVRMEIISDEELGLRLEDAYRFRAPRRLQESFAAIRG